MKTSWHAPHAYRVGDVAWWNGVRLVCTRHHYAGGSASHPWDPGWGWDEAERSRLWRRARAWERGPLLALIRGDTYRSNSDPRFRIDNQYRRTFAFRDRP
jgi:hypothetical protein